MSQLSTPSGHSRREAEFTEFAAARMEALRRFAFLLCQDWYRADDLVQAAFTRLYANWERAKATDHIEAYVRTMLTREFLTERRSAWARRVSLNGYVPDLASVQPDSDAALDVNAVLAQVPPRQRATIVLRFYCDLTVDQTAEVLGCAPGTVKSQTAKALDSLRRALEPVERLHRPREVRSDG